MVAKLSNKFNFYGVTQRRGIYEKTDSLRNGYGNHCLFFLYCFFEVPPERNKLEQINSFPSSIAIHKETSDLFCDANQMTGFYKKRINGLKNHNSIVTIDNHVNVKL